jgi:hypothetical protein
MNISFPWFGNTYIDITIGRGGLYHSQVDNLVVCRVYLDEYGDVKYASSIFSI